MKNENLRYDCAHSTSDNTHALGNLVMSTNP